MKLAGFRTGVSVLAICAPFAVAAQGWDVDYSFGIELNDMTLSVGGSTLDEGQAKLAYIEGRATYDIGDFYVGGKLSYGTGLGDSIASSLARATVIGGYETGRFDFFASAGYVGMTDAGGSSFEGETYSLGMDYAINSGAKLRIELVQDQMREDGTKIIPRDVEGTGIRAGAVFEF